MFIVGYILTSILSWHWATCQESLHTTIVIRKANNCQMNGLKWFLEDVSTHYKYPRTYINVTYLVTEEIKKMRMTYLRIERCLNQGNDCEDYQTWQIGDLCEFMYWQKQIWTEFVNALRPQFRCPVKKGFYEARNVSLDTDNFLKWYPNMEKYRWRAQCKVLNENSEVIYCGIIEADFQRIKIQDRRPPRKSRNNFLEGFNSNFVTE